MAGSLSCYSGLLQAGAARNSGAAAVMVSSFDLLMSLNLVEVALTVAVSAIAPAVAGHPEGDHQFCMLTGLQGDLLHRLASVCSLGDHPFHA